MRRGAAIAAAILLAPVWAAAQDIVPDASRIDLDPTDDPNEMFWDRLEERERQDEEAARESGESQLPIFVGPGEERAAAEEPAPEPEEAEPARVEYRDPPARVEVPAPRGDGANEGLGLAIGLLFEQWNRAPNVVRIVYRSAAEEEDAGGVDGGQASGEAAPPLQAAPGLPQVAAGDGLYGRVLYGVSSDYPGPVLLEVLQHPLSGAVLRGGFEIVRERLVLRFSSMEFRGRRVAIEALAVDPDCACYGVEGDVDRHFFERVLMPAALAFGQGYLEALASPATTVTTVQGELVVEERADREDAELYAGAAGAARTLGSVLLETAPRGPTVTLARDTELVVVFTSGLDGAGPGAGDG